MITTGILASTVMVVLSGWVPDATLASTGYVPTNAKAGTFPVDAKVASGTQPVSAKITVDPKMPMVIMQMDPQNPTKGQYVHVRARFLVDAREGDRIQWEDGQVTTLGRPLVGRVFTFNLRVSLRPLHGLLLTRVGSLPISLM